MTVSKVKNSSNDEEQITSDESHERASAPSAPPRVFACYSDAELDRLLSDIRRLDEDDFVGIAHSAAVKD